MQTWTWYPGAHGGALISSRWPWLELDVLVSPSGGSTVARWRLASSGRVLGRVVAARG